MDNALSKRIAEACKAAAAFAPDANLDECRAALITIIYSTRNNEWLKENDPKALEQAMYALRIKE